MKTRICLWSYESSFHLVAPMISIHPRTPHPCPRWSWCSRCCDIGYCCVVFVVSHHCLCLCVARLKFIILGSHMCTLTYLIILQYPLLSPCKWIIVHFKYSMIQAEDVSKVMMLVVVVHYEVLIIIRLECSKLALDSLLIPCFMSVIEPIFQMQNSFLSSGLFNQVPVCDVLDRSISRVYYTARDRGIPWATNFYI